MHRFVLILLLLSVGFAACGRPPAGHGRVLVNVHTQGLSASDVQRMVVTISGPSFHDITQELLLENGVWQDFIGKIPVGPNRTFQVKAFDGSNTVLYEGQLSGVTVTEQDQTLVFVLQQKTPPTPFSNTVPEITGLVLSKSQVAPGDSVSLTSTAQDPYSNDTLTYQWTATGGSFQNATNSVSIWTAPTSIGTYTITLNVSDNRGGSVTASVNIQVQ